MSRQRHQTKVEMPKLVRLLLGMIITAIGYWWLMGAQREELLFVLFEFLFCTGFITSIVAGSPLGWMLTAGYILVWNRFDSLLLDAVLNGQIEPPIFVGAFAVAAGAGGLFGWGFPMLIQSLLKLILRK